MHSIHDNGFPKETWCTHLKSRADGVADYGGWAPVYICTVADELFKGGKGCGGGGG